MMMMIFFLRNSMRMRRPSSATSAPSPRLRPNGEPGCDCDAQAGEPSPGDPPGLVSDGESAEGDSVLLDERSMRELAYALPDPDGQPVPDGEPEILDPNAF